MNRRFPVLLLLATLAAGAGASAQRPPASATPGSTTLRMDGTIDRYDASAGILSLSTPGGTVRIPLAVTARIRQGWRRIDAPALEKLTGHRAAIRYAETGGVRTVESVHVFGKTERGDR
jgi:phage baseplate assembly protein gpV